MTHAIQYMMTFQELAQTILEKEKIHEGIWAVSVEFQMAATMAGPNAQEVMPSAIASVARVGIQRAESLSNNLAFDAAVLNPAPTSKTRRSATRKKSASVK